MSSSDESIVDQFDSGVECDDTYLTIHAIGQNHSQLTSIMVQHYDTIYNFLYARALQTSDFSESAQFVMTLNVDLYNRVSLIVSEEHFTGPRYVYTAETLDDMLMQDCAPFIDEFISNYYKDNTRTIIKHSVIIRSINF